MHGLYSPCGKQRAVESGNAHGFATRQHIQLLQAVFLHAHKHGGPAAHVKHLNTAVKAQYLLLYTGRIYAADMALKAVQHNVIRRALCAHKRVSAAVGAVGDGACARHKLVCQQLFTAAARKAQLVKILPGSAAILL